MRIPAFTAFLGITHQEYAHVFTASRLIGACVTRLRTNWAWTGGKSRGVNARAATDVAGDRAACRHPRASAPVEPWFLGRPRHWTDYIRAA